MSCVGGGRMGPAGVGGGRMGPAGVSGRLLAQQTGLLAAAQEPAVNPEPKIL